MQIYILPTYAHSEDLERLSTTEEIPKPLENKDLFDVGLRVHITCCLT